MHDFLVDLLICPKCYGELDWQIEQRSLNHIEKGEARCQVCHTSYPVQDGIGYFLLPDSGREDLWQEVDSHLVQHLQQNPEIEKRLMGVPLETLSPADQFFRAMVHEEREEFELAEESQSVANSGIYTDAYLSCWQSQTKYLMDRLASNDKPLIDLASGRGYLVEKLAQNHDFPIVATDFSPKVMRRNRRWFEYLGISDRVSLLAFDATKMPFKDASLEIMTSNLGLPNIKGPSELLHELRRVLAGRFMSITHFYPVDDNQNRELLRQANLETMLVRDLASASFEQSGLQVEFTNICLSLAEPTPVGVVLEGAGIDALPVAETNLEWCLLEAQQSSKAKH